MPPKVLIPEPRKFDPSLGNVPSNELQPAWFGRADLSSIYYSHEQPVDLNGAIERAQAVKKFWLSIPLSELALSDSRLHLLQKPGSTPHSDSVQSERESANPPW